MLVLDAHGEQGAHKEVSRISVLEHRLEAGGDEPGEEGVADPLEATVALELGEVRARVATVDVGEGSALMGAGETGEVVVEDGWERRESREVNVEVRRLPPLGYRSRG